MRRRYGLAPAPPDVWDEGVERLLMAFWTRVRRDLDAGQQETRDWLDSDAAAWWVHVSFPSRDVDQVGAWLRHLWRPRERAA